PSSAGTAWRRGSSSLKSRLRASTPVQPAAVPDTVPGRPWSAALTVTGWPTANVTRRVWVTNPSLAKETVYSPAGSPSTVYLPIAGRGAGGRGRVLGVAEGHGHRHSGQRALPWGAGRHPHRRVADEPRDRRRGGGYQGGVEGRRRVGGHPDLDGLRHVARQIERHGVGAGGNEPPDGVEPDGPRSGRNRPS